MTTTPQTVSGFAPVYKGSLYYEDAGSGQPVLLIHAGVADCSMWNDQYNLFSQSFRIIRYDMRGYGKSRTETTSFSNRQDIVDLFKYLRVEKACVIGISRGGQIALDFTLEHPECVTALVPVAAGISGFDFRADESDKARHEFEIFTHMDELWEKNAFDELVDLEVHVWADGASQPIGRASSQIRDYVHKIVRANYTRQDGQPTPQPLSPPAAGRLAEIHVPTLVLVGEYDTCGTLAMADKLEREIPHARKIVFPGTAHLLPMELSARFNEVVLNFLNEALA
jgi:pimeloyl-ACP methyl ester carboxylesterase